ncbi:Frigida domain-containing protein [Cephalotus follicularis]|uniref:FRIGIDA-like protein n=1 Tax=Cephalotus follicularis TaxID=3775 RepID=A0A1Q3D2V1_CEPFO|nr:Frigida domain-containing protein [Cephalotus follicularis]
MATLKTIAAALKLIDTKKDNLQKAYHDLHTQYFSLLSSSSPLSLSWSQIDSHFTAIQNSLTHRFHLLQSLESTQSPLQSPPQPSTLPASDTSTQLREPQLVHIKGPTTSASSPSHDRVDSVSNRTEFSQSSLDPLYPFESSTQNRDDSVLKEEEPSGDRVDSVPATRLKLRALCEKMDGKGLRRYINLQVKDRESIRAELPVAIRVAPDPGAMVLDAMEGFYEETKSSKGDSDSGFCGIRRACVLLLEVLMGISPSFSSEVRERAKMLALEWKTKASLNGENSLEPLGLLTLVSAYKLENEFEKSELVDYFVVVARYRQGTVLCRAIGMGDKVVDLIQKLIDNGKQFLAVKYILEFGLSDRFPPVLLLKAYLDETTKLAKEVRRAGMNSRRSQNEARAKELSALRSVIKVIAEHKLESDYPLENIERRIKLLEKEKADRKGHPAARVAAEAQKQQQAEQPLMKKKKKMMMMQQQQQQQQKQSGNKRPRTTAYVGPTAVPMRLAGANSAPNTFPKAHSQPASLLPDHPASYSSSPAVPYGLMGSSSAAVPYAGSSAELYGLAVGSSGYPGNPNASGSSLYSESHMPSGYYDWTAAYGGYGLPPQYHQSYYPQ